MRKRNRRKLEKKQKAKREHRLTKPVSLVYRGNKYKNKELTPVFFQTELGIHEVDVWTGRSITDHKVRSALEKLIAGIRQSSLPPLEDSIAARGDNGNVEDLLIWNVRSRWEHFFESEPHPGRDRLIGVLRTILGSIEVWGSVSPTSRGYLKYIEEFVHKLGASVNECSADELDAVPAIE